MNNYILYKVTSPSKKIYFGITKRPLNERKYYHHYEAVVKKTNYKFHRAIRKYKNKLKWKIVKKNLTKKQAIFYERKFIKKYDTFNKGYNSTFGGEAWDGVKFTKKRLLLMSEITKKQFKNQWMRDNISKKMKEKFNNPKFRKKHSETLKKINGTKKARLLNSRRQGGKPFNCYNLITKKFIKSYDIISDAIRELGLPNGKISWCLKGKRNFTHFYIFKYKDDPTVKGKKYNHEWDKKIKRRPNANIRKKTQKITNPLH